MVLPQEYTDKPVTEWGGMHEMKMMIEKTGIIEQIEQLPLPKSTSNNSIPVLDIIESFWVSIWIGYFRFSHTAVIRVDEVLRQIFDKGGQGRISCIHSGCNTATTGAGDVVKKKVVREDTNQGGGKNQKSISFTG